MMDLNQSVTETNASVSQNHITGDVGDGCNKNVTTTRFHLDVLKNVETMSHCNISFYSNFPNIQFTLFHLHVLSGLL